MPSCDHCCCLEVVAAAHEAWVQDSGRCLFLTQLAFIVLFVIRKKKTTSNYFSCAVAGVAFVFW